MEKKRRGVEDDHSKSIHQATNEETIIVRSQNFDTWLHNFFLECFGRKEDTIFQKSKRNPRPNKALEHLRLWKKQCKAARKALLKSGLKGSPEEEYISKEWFSLIRQHNKLRVPRTSQAKL